ncbi:MAG: sulfite exporter TauE/SafE family protein [Gammaproteobacteria bacterium]|nr:sulfite exporter TauE/SafE family protein [Gammaproteobacteria bacterium]
MPDQITALAAFLVGLLGSVHCIGMCGGIVGALTLGLPPATRNSAAAMLAYLLAYNIGRISSYAVAGMILGSLGQQFYALGDIGITGWISQWLSGLFMIALGIYLIGWTKVLAPLERAGTHLWRKIEPLGKRFLPIKSVGQALGLGLVWGWLPCGMVYSVLVWAMMAGDALRGTQIMVAFGLGTLPMLLLMGGAARWLGSLVRKNWIRRTAGILIITFGLVGLLLPHAHHQHGEHEGHEQHSHNTQQHP